MCLLVSYAIFLGNVYHKVRNHLNNCLLIGITKNIFFQNKTLPIEQARPEDRGIYRCLADNAVRPPDFYDVTLYVDFKPVARAVQSSYGQAENRMFDITIECTVAGRWIRPGE